MEEEGEEEPFESSPLRAKAISLVFFSPFLSSAPLRRPPYPPNSSLQEFSGLWQWESELVVGWGRLRGRSDMTRTGR